MALEEQPILQVQSMQNEQTEQDEGTPQGSEDKANELRKYFFGCEEVWAVLGFSFGLTFVVLGLSSWFPPWLMSYALSGRLCLSCTFRFASLPRIITLLIGIGALGNSVMVVHIRWCLLNSKEFKEMTQVAASETEREQNGEPTLIDQLEITKRNAYYKTAGLWIILILNVILLEQPPYSYRIAAFVTGVVVFQLLPQYTITERFVFNAVNLCNADVDIVISMMEPSKKVAWSRVGQAVGNLDYRMLKFWSPTRAGWLIAVLLAGRVIVAAVFVTVALGISNALGQMALMTIAFVLLLHAVYLMWVLAQTTDKCASGSARHGRKKYSIPAVAAAFVGDDSLDKDARIDHFRFMQVLQTHSPGVNVCGVLVTKDLVIALLYKLTASFPLIMTVLSRLDGV